MDFDNTSAGNVRISHDVISSIAKYATLEIDGAESVAMAGVKGIVGKGKYARPIKVDITDSVVSVEINVIVRNGVKIPEIASAIQQNVKNAIQSMTGLAVSMVDIVVAGIALVSEDPKSE